MQKSDKTKEKEKYKISNDNYSFSCIVTIDLLLGTSYVAVTYL